MIFRCLRQRKTFEEGAIFIVGPPRNYKNSSLLQGFSLPQAAENHVNHVQEKMLIV
jgi:hypothetical protein